MTNEMTNITQEDRKEASLWEAFGCHAYNLPEHFARHREAAERAERYRIVAWLLDEKKGNGNWLDGGRYLAECIANGEHLK
jgi:hypothetical protein